ncbi:MAG TPA: membrane protein insertase YidC [Thermodesulfobacteriota bacterium]|nr:membrane protein insertase YidC [Thermodesulfobacteriota bacterium]
MDKKAFLAIIISIGILLLYPYIIKKVYPPRPAETRAEKAAPEKVAQVAPGVSPPGEAMPGEAPKEPEITFTEVLTTVDTPLYRAVFTNHGGAVKEWELKRYTQARETGSGAVDLARIPGRHTSFGTSIAKETSTSPVVFTPSAKNITFDGDGGDGGDGTAELTFAAVTPEGVRIEKKLTFDASDYAVKTELTLQNVSGKPFSGFVETALAAGFEIAEKSYFHIGPLVKTQEKVIRQDAEDFQDSGMGKVHWLGLEDKYFLTVFIPATDIPVNWTTEITSTALTRAKVLFALELAPGQTAAYSYDAFMGPKEYDLLLARGMGLEEAIEFGFFSFMAKPLLVVLNFFQRYLVNYGLAIILLTVVIKVAFYPLTKHSLSSMKEMQRVQPQLVAIKEKYKDDKEKMNREVMELYKKYKINPVSGCLPMILQIPVFIALYEVLYVAIELRHAPFVLWLTDLSAKDPYYVTPVLMGGSMFLQQKMTPTSVDPTQAKVMLLMPIVFTVMFLKFPSGLVIYWLVNNILSIAQQHYVNRTHKAKA